MEVLSYVYTFLNYWIIGTFWWLFKIISEIIKLHKVHLVLRGLAKRLFGKQEPSMEPKPDEKPALSTEVPPKKTYVRTVGKDTPDYTPYVSATGLRADTASDVREALQGVDTLETIGLQGGSAMTVEATGIDLRKRQARPGEGSTGRDASVSGKGGTFTVTGIQDGRAQTVFAVGVRH